MDLWVFDNDGTLYDHSIVEKKFMGLLYEYVSRLLGISTDEAVFEVKRLKEKWHTQFSIITLIREYKVDFSRIIESTYLKINFHECGIIPDASKLGVLSSIGARKIVFTNNPSFLARRVLSLMGLADCFSDFIGMEETNFYSKPDPKAYKFVEARHRGYDRIIFCDDSLENLETARKLGWTTIWYKPQGAGVEMESGHLVISLFEQLKGIV
jgi:putative hydrolase of the HAD superfamily